MLIPSTNVDKKLLETEFLIVICRHTGDKWQSKTLFLAIFDPHSLIGKSVLIAAYQVCIWFVTITWNGSLYVTRGYRLEFPN